MSLAWGGHQVGNDKQLSCQYNYKESVTGTASFRFFDREIKIYYLSLFKSRLSRLKGLKPIEMTDPEMERPLAEQVVQILRERLKELEILQASGSTPEDTSTRLALVRKLLARLEEQLRKGE